LSEYGSQSVLLTAGTSREAVSISMCSMRIRLLLSGARIVVPKADDSISSRCPCPFATMMRKATAMVPPAWVCGVENLTSPVAGITLRSSANKIAATVAASGVNKPSGSLRPSIAFSSSASLAASSGYADLLMSGPISKSDGSIVSKGRYTRWRSCPARDSATLGAGFFAAAVVLPGVPGDGVPLPARISTVLDGSGSTAFNVSA